MKKMTFLTLVVAFVVTLVSTSIAKAGLHDKIVARRAESSKPTAVEAELVTNLSLSYDASYDAIANILKKEGWDISTEYSSSVNGTIVTSYKVTGGYKQNGKRVMITTIKEDGGKATTLRVAVTDQKRYKGLTTEPWEEAKINTAETTVLVSKIKEQFQPTSSQTASATP